MSRTLFEHAAGSLHLLMEMANGPLVADSQQDRKVIDEILCFEVFPLPPTSGVGSPSSSAGCGSVFVPFRAWLYRSATNELRMHYRKQKRMFVANAWNRM